LSGRDFHVFGGSLIALKVDHLFIYIKYVINWSRNQNQKHNMTALYVVFITFVRNPSVSLSPTLIRNEKVEHKSIVLKF